MARPLLFIVSGHEMPGKESTMRNRILTIAAALSLACGTLAITLAGAGTYRIALPGEVMIGNRIFSGETLELDPTGHKGLLYLRIDGEVIGSVRSHCLCHAEKCPVVFRFRKDSSGIYHIESFVVRTAAGTKVHRKFNVLRVAKNKGRAVPVGTATARADRDSP